MNASTRNNLLILLLVTATLLAYLPALRSGYIWDDDAYVTGNQALRSAGGLVRIWFTPGTTPQYYPLTFTSFWVEYHLWQLKPMGYHLVNVLLHALNAILLWRLLRRMDIAGAWWAAALFALHPVMVESVAWITERKNVLSTLFYLLAVLAYLRFRPLRQEVTRRGPWRWYALAFVLFLCALLSKTVTCTLPATLALLIGWKRGRLDRRDALALAPLFVLGLAMGLTTAWLEKHLVGASGAEWGMSLVERCLMAGRALWFYAGKLVWPVNLTFIYPRWTLNAGVLWQYLFPLAAVAVLVALWSLRKRIGKGPMVAVLFFAGSLLPALGFVDVFPFLYSFVADHFQYLASLGLITLLAGAGATLAHRTGRWGRVWAGILASAVLLLFGLCTWQQTRIYQDQETLWRNTLARNPNAGIAHNNLGVLLAETGRPAEALSHYREVLRLKPDDVEAHNNIAWLLATCPEAAHRDGAEAVRLAERARTLAGSDSSGLLDTLAAAYAEAGRFAEAVKTAEQALALARSKPERKLAGQIESHLQRYRQGQPWREK